MLNEEKKLKGKLVLKIISVLFSTHVLILCTHKMDGFSMTEND